MGSLVLMFPLAFPVLLQYSVLNRILTELNRATWSFMVFAMHELVFHCC